MEEKLVINELQQGKELANRLRSNLKNNTSSSDSKNKILISEILGIYQNVILMLSLREGNDKNKNMLKRSNPEIEHKGFSKKRKMLEKKTKGSCIDDGYCWRKYGQKEIHGSTNPRTENIGDHTCNNNNNTSPKTTNFSVFLLGNKVGNVKEQSSEEDAVKPKKKTEETTIISVEDLEKEKDIFKTFSFCNQEVGNALWKDNMLTENSVGHFSPAASESGITSEVSSYLENSESADSYFSSLDSIFYLGQNWLWS